MIAGETIFSVDQLVLFLIFFIPGFIAVKVYDLLIPTERRNWQNALFEVIAYSTLNFIVLSGLVALIIWIVNLPATYLFHSSPPIAVGPLFWLASLRNLQSNLFTTQEFSFFVVLFISLLGMPALLSFLAYRLSSWGPVRDVLGLSPWPTAWDTVFSQQKLPPNARGYFLVVNLKNGDEIRGFYGKNSSASAYPHEPQIYLEEKWFLTHDGSWKKADGTAGVLVSSKEIEKVEFYKPI